jgi:hypothetical protein
MLAPEIFSGWHTVCQYADESISIPMRPWIVVCLVTLLLLAAVRLLINTSNRVDDEMESYVGNLNYLFTARVDSVVLLNGNGLGYMVGHITSGVCDKFKEDSLNRHLVNYRRIRILDFTRNGDVKIYSGKADTFLPMDSISVNSAEDRLDIFRKDNIILKSKLSNTGYYKVNFAFWLKD